MSPVLAPVRRSAIPARSSVTEVVQRAEAGRGKAGLAEGKRSRANCSRSAAETSWSRQARSSSPTLHMPCSANVSAGAALDCSATIIASASSRHCVASPLSWAASASRPSDPERAASGEVRSALAKRSGTCEGERPVGSCVGGGGGAIAAPSCSASERTLPSAAFSAVLSPTVWVTWPAESTPSVTSA